MDDLEPQDNWERRARYWQSEAAKHEKKARYWDLLTEEGKYAPVRELISQIDDGKYEPGKKAEPDPEIEEMRSWYKQEKARRKEQEEQTKQEWFRQVTQKEQEWSTKRPELAGKGYFGAQGKVNAALANHRFPSWDEALRFVAWQDKLDLESAASPENGSQAAPDTKPTEEAGATPPVGGKAPSKASPEPRSWHEAMQADKAEWSQEHGR